MSFNASDPSGAGGLAGDVATIAAMGAHALPVVTSIVMRDTAEVFDQHAHRRRRGRRAGAQHPRRRDHRRLEGRLPRLGRGRQRGGRDPLRLPGRAAGGLHAQPVAGSRRTTQQAYLDAFRELVLPQTEVLVGSHQTLTDFLLPDWDSERPASPRELAVAAAEHGTRFVLVTSVVLPNTKGPDQFLDNVLASPQGAITGEKFERFEVALRRRRRHAVGRAGRAAGLGRRTARRGRRGADLPRPGARRRLPPRHGQRRCPDRFFWALPPGEEGEDGEPAEDDAATDDTPEGSAPCPLRHKTNAGAVRARPAGHPRRRQLAGARLPRRRRHAALHRPRRRAPTCSTPRASATSTTSAPGGR